MENPNNNEFDNLTDGDFFDFNKERGDPLDNEIPSFVPTQNELTVLARYHTRNGIIGDHREWVQGPNHHSDHRFAWTRVEKIARVLGEETVNRIAQESLIAIREECENDEFWEGLFRDGYPVERVDSMIGCMFQVRYEYGG